MYKFVDTPDELAILATQRLTEHGWEPHHAAGIVGNLIHESGMKPEAVGDQGASLGLAQWNKERRSALKEFARERNSNINDFYTQIDFISHELKNNETIAGEALRKTTNAQDAMWVFSNMYERPGKPMIRNRASMTNRILSLLGMPIEAFAGDKYRFIEDDQQPETKYKFIDEGAKVPQKSQAKEIKLSPEEGLLNAVPEAQAVKEGFPQWPQRQKSIMMTNEVYDKLREKYPLFTEERISAIPQEKSKFEYISPTKRFEEITREKPTLGESLVNNLIENKNLMQTLNIEKILPEEQRGERIPRLRKAPPSGKLEIIAKNITAVNRPLLESAADFATIVEDVLALPYKVITGDKRPIQRPFTTIAKTIKEVAAPQELEPTEEEWLSTLPGQVAGGILPYITTAKLFRLPQGMNLFEKYLHTLGMFLPIDVARGYRQEGLEGAKKGLYHAVPMAAAFTVAQNLPGIPLQSVGTGTVFAGSSIVAGERNPKKLTADFLTGVGLHWLGSRGEARKKNFEKFIEEWKKENNVTDKEFEEIKKNIETTDFAPEAPAQTDRVPAPEVLAREAAGIKEPGIKEVVASSTIPLNEKGTIGFDISGKPPKDPELVKAEEKISSRISRREYEDEPGTTKKDVYTWLVDKFHPLKKLVQSYSGRGLSAAEDPYKQARLFAGWHGKAEAFLEYFPFNRVTFEFEKNLKSLKAIIEPIYMAGDYDSFGNYLVSRRALERKTKDLKTGVDIDDAQTTVEKLSSKFEKSANDFEKYMDAVLRYARDSNLISAERYLQIKKGSIDYSPLLRVFEPEKVQGGGKGFEAGQPVKKFKGSERKIVDPIEAAMRLTYLFVNSAEKNNVGTNFINWAKSTEAFGNEVNKVSRKNIPIQVKLSEVIKDKEIINLIKESGFTEDEVAIFRPSASRPAGNVIAVWENGKRQYYEVPKDIADIVQGMDTESVNLLLKIASAPAQALRLGATTLSPEFGIRNFLKDQFPAFFHSKYGYLPLIDYFRGVTQMVRGGEKYWQYMISGAPHAELVSMDRRLLQKKIKDIVEGRLAFPGFIVRHPVEAMKILSEYSERGTRIGEFLKGIEKEGGTAKDIQEAGYQAREVTVDFGRKGGATVVKALNMLEAFWNANIQGVDKVARAHKENPWGTMLKAGAAITLPSILLEMAFHDDPRYQELPWWRRDLFFNIPSPAGVISLPKPWTYGLLYGSIPQRIVNYMMNQDPNVFNKTLEVIEREVPNIPLTTMARPFLEAWANRSFYFDKPIVPQWKEELPPKYQYGYWTSDISKELGKAISKIPIVKDSKMASPAVIDNFVLAWTGGAGRLALNVIDEGLRQSGITSDIPKPQKELGDYPIIRAIIRKNPGADAQSIQDFYENVEKTKSAGIALTQEALKLARQGKKTEIPALIKELGPDAFIKLDSIRGALGESHRFIEYTHDNPNMSPQEKKEAITKTYISMISITKKVNMAIEKSRIKAQQKFK